MRKSDEFEQKKLLLESYDVRNCTKADTNINVGILYHD